MMTHSDLIIRDKMFTCDFDSLDQEVLNRARAEDLPEEFVVEFKFGDEIYSFGSMGFHELSSSLLSEISKSITRQIHDFYASGYPALYITFEGDIINFFFYGKNIEIGNMRLDFYIERIADILSRLENIRYFSENYKSRSPN